MQKIYKKKKYLAIFTLPTLIAYAIAFVVPFFMGLYLSFCNFKTIGNAKFVGLSNFAYVFQTATAFWPRSVYCEDRCGRSYFYECHCFRPGSSAYQRTERNQCLRTIFFMPRPDRRYYPGLYLAASAERYSDSAGGSGYSYSSTYDTGVLLFCITGKRSGI